MSDSIIFGTDGWRASVAEDYTFDIVRRCTQGFADYLHELGTADKGPVIGYDQRYRSEHFAAAAAEVMAANGIRVWLTDGPTPTPVISYSVVAKGACGAVNITASHNPSTDNGYKVRDETGGAIAPDNLKRIETLIPAIDGVKRVRLNDALEQGMVSYHDGGPDYLAQIGRLIDVRPIRDAGLRIVVDCMWGNGIGWFTRILGGGKTEIIEIHNQRHPLFPEMIRPEPIPPNVDAGLARARELGADVVIMNDGDADRVGIGDEHGRFIDQLRVFGLLGYYFLQVRGERGPIVKTISTTKMLNKLGKLYGVPIHETGVGFKYIAPKFTETRALLGGEESGGYAFRGHVPERDGILAGLYLLDMMVRLDRKPSELIELLFSKVGAHHYLRIDNRFPAQEKASILARVAAARPNTIAGMAVTDIVTVDGHQFLMEDGGWLLIRFSGTEPIIRIYCETTREDKVDRILQDGMQIAGLG
ncbi:MAG: phosphoglucomutase/phosphomannomutase family protein [Ardenticatenales bacterium]|nr:phosphoglucomutase/phosphomannomutase family protein [Ardenticatenales bacterium]